MADILITHAENFSPEARRVLEGAGHGVLGIGADLLWRDNVERCTVLWCRTERPAIHLFPHLKVLATNCTGTDHLPLDECARRNIRVVSLQDCREQMGEVWSTAEHTVGLILALLRQIPAAVAHVKGVYGGALPDWDRWQFVGRELRGKSVGIVGWGRVGSQVATLLEAFGCKVAACFIPPIGVEREFILKHADIITCHADLNDTSRGMFNAERFSQMKPGAYFINTARGAIVDEGALLEALESGRLAGAALDVVCDEPNTNPALVEFARREPGRLILTPHVGGCTVEGLHLTEEILAAKLVEVLAEPKKRIVTSVEPFEATYTNIGWGSLKKKP